MPFTPFHAGPAFFIKAARPDLISLPVFGFANTLVDVEVLVMAARGIHPTHTYMHTFVGATGAALVAVLMGVFLLPLMARVWNGFVGPSGYDGEHWLRMGGRPSRRALWLSALFGAWSHVFLDALHHPHSFPLWPFTKGNPLLVSGMLDSHLVAIALCVLGFGAIVLAGHRRRRKRGEGAPANVGSRQSAN